MNAIHPGPVRFSGQANFLLVRLDRPDADAPALARQMLSSGIAVRVCDNFDGLDRRFFRIAVRSEEENLELLRSLRKALRVSLPSRMGRQRTPALCFKGRAPMLARASGSCPMPDPPCRTDTGSPPSRLRICRSTPLVTREGGEMGRARPFKPRHAGSIRTCE